MTPSAWLEGCRGTLGPDGKWNPSSESSACPGVSSQFDKPETLPPGGLRGASLPDEWTISAPTLNGRGPSHDSEFSHPPLSLFKLCSSSLCSGFSCIHDSNDTSRQPSGYKKKASSCSGGPNRSCDLACEGSSAGEAPTHS